MGYQRNKPKDINERKPTGVSIPLDQRKELLNLALRYGFTIIEDNPYGVFGNHDTRYPTIYSLDDSLSHVAYIGSFSKTVFPSARVGFVVTPPLSNAITKIKSMLTLNTSPICQALVAGVLLDCEGDLVKHCKPEIDYYQSNLNHLLSELATVFEGDDYEGIQWNQPEGGFFLMMTLPFEITDDLLAESAERFSVIWSPMEMFYAPPLKGNKIRLSFSYLCTSDITEGVRRLKRFIDHCIDN